MSRTTTRAAWRTAYRSARLAWAGYSVTLDKAGRYALRMIERAALVDVLS